MRFDVPGRPVADPKACQCGEVLKGVLKPWECKVFGTACTPETPIGTCMVSSEGACAAYYNYGRYAPSAGRQPEGSSACDSPKRGRRAIEHHRDGAPPRSQATNAITMAHGAGGKASRALVEGLLVPAFDNRASLRSATPPSWRSLGGRSR